MYTRYRGSEPMVLLVDDLTAQNFVAAGVHGEFGLMEVTAPGGQLVGYWTDSAYRRRPYAVVRQIVRAAQPFGFVPPIG